MEEYDNDLNIEPYMDEVVFTMDPDLIDWETASEMSDADPSSKEYRKMMEKLGISGRFKNNRTRKWRTYDDEYGY